MLVRKYLHARGFRYSLHRARLPGRPDIVLRRYRTVVQVQGCFWHQHPDPSCRAARLPHSNRTRRASPADLRPTHPSIASRAAEMRERGLLGAVTVLARDCTGMDDPFPIHLGHNHEALLRVRTSPYTFPRLRSSAEGRLEPIGPSRQHPPALCRRSLGVRTTPYRLQSPALHLAGPDESPVCSRAIGSAPPRVPRGRTTSAGFAASSRPSSG